MIERQTLLPRPDAGFERVDTGIVIARPPADVFAFVTNASRWRLWHPATAAVREAPDRPLTAGETIVETIRAFGRTFDARWTVEVCEPPRQWAIATATERGAARIVYRLNPADGGCRFRRTLDFRSEGMWRMLDSTIARFVLARQSARALANLRRVLEAGARSTSPPFQPERRNDGT